MGVPSVSKDSMTLAPVDMQDQQKQKQSIENGVVRLQRHVDLGCTNLFTQSWAQS